MSRLGYQWMLGYLKMLDTTNAKILEGLGNHGPRNVLALAKSIGLPPTTVAFRIKKLMKEGFLRIRTNLNYSKLGLMKAVLVAESKPGQKRKLQQVIDNLDYWTYEVRCYGKYDGYYTVFAFPAEYKKDQYLGRLLECSRKRLESANSAGERDQNLLQQTILGMHIPPNRSIFALHLLPHYSFH